VKPDHKTDHFTFVGRTELMSNSRAPSFRSVFHVDLAHLKRHLTDHNNDSDFLLRFEVFDGVSAKHRAADSPLPSTERLMGVCTMSVREVLGARKATKPLSHEAERKHACLQRNTSRLWVMASRTKPQSKPVITKISNTNNVTRYTNTNINPRGPFDSTPTNNTNNNMNSNTANNSNNSNNNNLMTFTVGLSSPLALDLGDWSDMQMPARVVAAVYQKTHRDARYQLIGLTQPAMGQSSVEFDTSFNVSAPTTHGSHYPPGDQGWLKVCVFDVSEHDVRGGKVPPLSVCMGWMVARVVDVAQMTTTEHALSVDHLTGLSDEEERAYPGVWTATSRSQLRNLLHRARTRVWLRRLRAPL